MEYQLGEGFLCFFMKPALYSYVRDSNYVREIQIGLAYMGLTFLAQASVLKVFLPPSPDFNLCPGILLLK